MHLFQILAASTTSTTTSSSGGKGSSTLTLLVLGALVLGVYLVFLRPRQQRMRQQQAQSRQIAVGDEVMSAGGIHGTVIGLESDLAEVEVAPGVVLTFLRRALSRRAGGPERPPEPADEQWEVPGDDPSPEGDAGPGGDGS